ncbi:acyltransferase [Nanchangia anserum]|uniref:Acyltransferase n=1 Tax=Nanchangia anserum TaxID=2692125 RepID=A0A8I0KVR8_9ACTO|nr:acyltransferase family protein [Nanchangia anserum]MBD3689229.1 acyltransferase [Nanchangia anserum]QOX81452.1 acyltransferase [Nanchangia anserum]
MSDALGLTYTSSSAAGFTRSSSQLPRPPRPPHPRTSAPAPEPEPAPTSIRQVAPAGRFHVRGLDGLRALACIAVLLYHVLPTSLPGGFLGVDVFFVLSGFLITGLLIEERARSGRINLAQFWLRRVRRLVPAVSTMLVVTVPIAWAISRDLLVGIGRQIAGALAFVYNWVTIADGASYFDQQLPRLYMNVWSLGVEEQFYLVWPLIVVLAAHVIRRAWRRRLAWGAWALAACSAIAMAVVVANLPADQGHLDVTRAYMGTDTHCFGLMLGAGLALALSRPMAPALRRLAERTRRLRVALAWVGLAVIIAGFFIVPDDQAWTYPWGTLVVSLAVMGYLQGCCDEVSGASPASSWLTRAIDVAPLRWIGQRSYGIYLWHWPVIVMMETAFPQAPMSVCAVVALTLSVLAAAVSFALIEEPIRRRVLVGRIRAAIAQGLSVRTHWRLVAPATVVIIGTMFTCAAVADAPKQTALEQQLEAVATAPTQPSPAPAPAQPQAPTNAKPVTGDQVLVIGDSVTLGAKPALEQHLPGVIVDGKVSRSIFKAIPLMQSYAASHGQRPYVVISLATNTQMTNKQVDDIMAAAGDDTKIVFVDAFGPARDTWIPISNDVIANAQTRYPDRVRVAHWHDAIAAHTDWLGPDGTHPSTPDAENLYAQVIVDALNDFAKS